MRYYGKIGYFDTVETKPGLFEQELIFRTYKGDVLRNTSVDVQFPRLVLELGGVYHEDLE